MLSRFEDWCSEQPAWVEFATQYAIGGLLMATLCAVTLGVAKLLGWVR
jgi:hypothetical protein